MYPTQIVLQTLLISQIMWHKDRLEPEYYMNIIFRGQNNIKI